MTEDLGTRLLRAGLVTGTGLARCLSTGGRELEHGGRLAEALAEGHLPEDALAGFFLAEGFGPLLGEDALAAAEPSLLDRLPLQVAVEERCLPIGKGDHGIVVAMADPSSEAVVQLLEGHLGDNVLPAVARWSHLKAALDTAQAQLHPSAPPPSLEEPPEEAVLDLVRRRTPASPTTETPSEAPTENPVIIGEPEPDEAPLRQTAEFGILPLPLERSKPTIDQPRRGIDDWSDLSESPKSGGAPLSGSARAAGPARQNAGLRGSDTKLHDIGAQLNEMRSTEDRDLLFHRATEAMATVCRTVVLFVLRDGALKGWDGEGPDLNHESIRKFWIPTGSPSVFHDVVAKGDFYHGPHGERAADRMFRATVNSSGRVLLVVPVLVNGKVIALFACDDLRFGAAGVERARTLAHGTGTALKRIILSRRG